MIGASTSSTKVLQQGSRSSDIFEVEPQREQIAAHSYIYAVVSFTPPSLQVSASVSSLLVLESVDTFFKPATFISLFIFYSRFSFSLI